MYNDKRRLRLEQQLASTRRCLYRAIAEAELADFYTTQDDLTQIQLELGRVMADVQNPRVNLSVVAHSRT